MRRLNAKVVVSIEEVSLLWPLKTYHDWSNVKKCFDKTKIMRKRKRVVGSRKSKNEKGAVRKIPRIRMKDTNTHRRPNLVSLPRTSTYKTTARFEWHSAAADRFEGKYACFSFWQQHHATTTKNQLADGVSCPVDFAAEICCDDCRWNRNSVLTDVLCYGKK